MMENYGRARPFGVYVADASHTRGGEKAAKQIAAF
jgi:hypothetical protein